MPDYKAMYIKLFQSQTKAIQLLQSAQQETEEMYIASQPTDIKVLFPENPADNPDEKK